MSILTQQLNRLQLSQRHEKIGPNLPQPTILMDSYAARNTELDVIFSLAVMGYETLKDKLLFKEDWFEVLSEESRGLSRAKMTKSENRVWSEKLTKVLISLVPYLEDIHCQQVL